MSIEGKKTITKKDVTRRTAKTVGMKIYRVEKIVDSLFQALRELILEANPELRIEIRNFGVLEVKNAKAKPSARNPKTNEVVYLPAHRKTRFTPGKLLKEALRRPLSKSQE